MDLRRYNIFESLIVALHRRMTARQFLIFSSIMVGLSAGLAAVLLKKFVHFIRASVVEQRLMQLPWKYIYLLLPVIGIGITVFIVQRFFQGKLYRGNVNIMHSIARKGGFIRFEQMYTHIITSGFTVGFGGSAGLESPIVSTGSAIGSNYAKRYRLNFRERTLLLAAGAAGGIAGAFNAPIAGVLFALEVLLVDISIAAFIPLLIASASGALLSRIILEEGILLSFRLREPFNYYNTPLYILLGMAAGFISIYYVNVFDRTERLVQKVKGPYARWLTGSIPLVAALALLPALFGEGYETILALSELQTTHMFRDSLIGQYMTTPWAILLGISATLMLKSFTTALTLGSGGNGGNFAPSLFVGACLGFCFSQLLILLGLENIPVSNFTIVAMAGILTGVFHAPLTGIFLIAEVTGGYELIIPLMLVSCTSFIVVKYFHPQSLDVRRLRRKGTIISENKDTMTLGKIDINSLIENDFSLVRPDDSLRNLVDIIKTSRRNAFPVVSTDGQLRGVIHLDRIRNEIFNPDLYDKVEAAQLMDPARFRVEAGENIFEVMKKFDESGQWSLPVVENGAYRGFYSRSTILNQYRFELVASV